MAKQRGARAGTDWVLTWPLLAVFAAMVFLASEEMRAPRKDAIPTPAGGADWEEHLPERIAGLTRALEGASLPLPAPVEEPKGAGSLRWIHRRFEFELPRTESGKVDASLEALKQIDGGVTVATRPTFDGFEAQVGVDGLLTHTLRVHWQEREVRPRVALVVGPLGDDLRLARECLRIEAPLALSIRPFRPFSKEVAELGRIFEREVLVEIDGDAAAAPGSAGRVAEETLAEALASIPNAVGVSGITPGEDEGGAKLRALIRERGLFFVETAQSAAGGAEQTVGGSFVLDQEQGGGLGVQVDRLAARALGKGTAIGFGRSNESTITALGPAIEKLREQKIELVPVSALAGVALSGR